MPKEGRRVGVYTYLDPNDFKKITDESRETGISISGLIRRAVKRWIRNPEAD